MLPIILLYTKNTEIKHDIFWELVKNNCYQSLIVTKSTSKCSKRSIEFFHIGNIRKDKISAKASDVHFINICSMLASRIPDLGINYKNFIPHQKRPFYSSPIGWYEVTKIIVQMRDGVPSKDRMSSKLLNCISEHIGITWTRLSANYNEYRDLITMNVCTNNGGNIASIGFFEERIETNHND